MKNLSAKKLIFFLFISLNALAQDGTFSFTIASSLSTSAGVFKDDSILVRTLWNTVRYTAGTYSKYWDGKDDLGNVVTSPLSSYKVKVLTNNVKYTWEGTIGNTSDSMTGDSKLLGIYSCMSGIAFADNGYGYYCVGYSEGHPGYYKFLNSKPQQKIDFYLNYSGRIMTLNTVYVATDNVNVYWAGYDSYSPGITGKYRSMVHAIRTTDDANTTFENGTPYTVVNGVTFPSVISKITDSAASGYITGLAVQKTHNYLFVARAGINQLQVLNKTTGALVQTLSYAMPRTLCVDKQDNLWMVSGTNTVTRYSVNSNGALAANLTLAGLLEPLALQVSANGSMITVADGAASQQVKAFDNATGVVAWTLGTAGGYAYDGIVNNNKFYFSDGQGYDQKNRPVFLAFQSNGSFWVGDGGNSRVQHYDSSRTFIDRIMSLPASYHVYADPNDATRVWSDGLEFAIDYSQPLRTGWKLVRNWGANITPEYSVTAFEQPTTLSNKHTYALIKKIAGSSTREIVEFLPTGKLRFTGIISHGARIIAPDGAIQVYNRASVGGMASVSRYPLTGFDQADNPVWSTTAEVLCTTPSLTINDPNTTALSGNCITATNKIIIWNPDKFLGSSTLYPGYHLGSIQRGGKDWLWKTEQATHVNYRGPYPGVGYFDIGNQVKNNGGGTLSILGRNIITSYHGEFWKNGQTNKYNHYYDNGLSIGQFGITKDETSGGAPAGYCGNALTPMVVADPNDASSAYLYHGDEATHSGVHRWKITGLNTIAEQVIPVNFPADAANSPLLQNIGYTDLMINLKFDSILATNTAGWTRVPALEAPGWNIVTSYFQYDKLAPKDIHLNFSQPLASTYYLNRDLGINNIVSNWKIRGNIAWGGSDGNRSSSSVYLDIVDANDKMISTLCYNRNYTTTTNEIIANGKILSSLPNVAANVLTRYFRPLEISMINGNIYFSYNDQVPVLAGIADSTANWRTIKTLRVRCVSDPGSGPTSPKCIDLSDFRFYRDTVAENIHPVANAGRDTILNSLQSYLLNGSGTDRDGTITSYLWTEISGPVSCLINAPAAASTAINNLTQGVYQYQLKVTDNSGAVSNDSVKVTVNNPPVNQAPVANAGRDVYIVWPLSSVRVSGTGVDADGTVISQRWKITSGPAGYSISDPTAKETSIEHLSPGVYVVEYMVTDNRGEIAKDIMCITISLPALAQFNTTDFKVSPNPLTDNVELAFSSVTIRDKLLISVYNSSGMLVKQVKFMADAKDKNYKLDMSSLSDGAYIITVRFGDGHISNKKVLKLAGR